MQKNNYKLRVPSGKYQRGEVRLSMECAYPDLRDLLHNFRGLQRIPLWKRMALDLRKKTAVHSRPVSLLQKHNNMS